MNAPNSPSGRLMSLDALRGFDMFWILGADALVHALSEVNGSALARFLAAQLTHKEWAGFAFYDLIFPLFVFISGVSLVWSLSRQIAEHGRAVTARRVVTRGAILFVIGIFYSGGFTNPWPDLRLLGVLQRIALAYTGAGLLFCFLRPRALVAAAALLLAGYWALLTFVPIRDIQLEKAALARVTGTASPTPAQVRAAFDATTARVTGGSVDNLKLIGSKQSEVALVMVDAALDALKGEDKFKGSAVEVRTLMVLYPNRMHVVSVEGKEIGRAHV